MFARLDRAQIRKGHRLALYIKANGMHGPIVTTLTENPILTLFIVIGLGYLLGEISFFGFRFGIVGVLFVGTDRPQSI